MKLTVTGTNAELLAKGASALRLLAQQLRDPRVAGVAASLWKAERAAIGHVIIGNMLIAIEFPVGAPRFGRPLEHAYGRIEGTRGQDGDAVDCFLGPDYDAPNAWTIQTPDEEKIMLGWQNGHEAVAAFVAMYGPERMRGVTCEELGRLRARLYGEPVQGSFHVASVIPPAEVAKAGVDDLGADRAPSAGGGGQLLAAGSGRPPASSRENGLAGAADALLEPKPVPTRPQDMVFTFNAATSAAPVQDFVIAATLLEDPTAASQAAEKAAAALQGFADRIDPAVAQDDAPWPPGP